MNLYCRSNKFAVIVCKSAFDDIRRKTMFARKLQPSEYWRAELNMAVAFESSFKYGKEMEKSKTAERNPQEDYYGTFLSEKAGVGDYGHDHPGKQRHFSVGLCPRPGKSGATDGCFCRYRTGCGQFGCVAGRLPRGGQYSHDTGYQGEGVRDRAFSSILP